MELDRKERAAIFSLTLVVLFAMFCLSAVLIVQTSCVGMEGI